MKLTRKAQLTSLISAALMTMAGAAYAEQTEQDSGAEDENVLEEVVVTAQSFRDSLRSSIATKENASQIVDAITAEDMGRFPAQNLAEAMQGIPGVTMTRDDGLGEFISIRGMAPELTRVEIDGRSVSLTAGSSDPDNATTMSFFSPDMFNKVTVIKSPRAIDVEGGVGGTVKLETLRPLDVGKNITRLAGQYGENTVKDDPSYTVGIFTNWVWDRVGLTLGANYTDADRRIDQSESLDGWSLWDDDDPNSGYYPERIRLNQRVGDQPRFNINGTLQWQATDNFEMWANFLYAKEDRDDVQQRFETEFDRARNIINGQMDDDGNWAWGFFERTRTTINFIDRKRDIEQYGGTIGGEWANETWIVTGKVNYSESEEDSFDARARARGNADAGYDARNLTYITVIEVPGSDDLDQYIYGEPDFPNYNRVDYNMRNIGTTETSGTLDFDWNLGDGLFSNFYFGTRLASKEVTRRQDQINSRDLENFENPVWNHNLLRDNFFFDSAQPPLLTNWVRPETAYMHSYESEVRSLASYDDKNNWSFTEDTWALYAMVDFGNYDAAVPYSGNIGVRYIDYEYNGQGFQDDPANPDELIPYTPTSNQDHWLPSFNSRFSVGEFEDGRYIRFAVGRVLSRPNPRFIAPVANLNEDLDGVSVGNPFLEPYLAWQYDLAYEHYFGESGEGLFAIGLFYKDVENFFEEVTLENQDLSPWGIPDTGTIETYVNGGTGKSSGFETSFQTPFTYWDNFLQNFGIVLNYTYVDSERKTVDGGKAPLPGTSKHSANGILYFVKNGWDARIVYNYRDTYLNNQDDQKYVKAQGRLDFALRYTFLDNWVASLDVANITSESEYSFYDNMESRFHKLQLEGRRWVVGLAYTFQ